MVTCCDIPGVIVVVKANIRQDIRADDGDIDLYLSGQMRRLASCVGKNRTLQEEIKQKVIDAADGM